MAERFGPALELTPAQKTEWDAAEREARAAVAPLLPRVRKAQRELAEATKQGTSADVVQERTEALRAAQADLRRARADMERRMLGVLTAEQRHKYELLTRR
jgi:Spy/CpxP family protein refolding chaperone